MIEYILNAAAKVSILFKQFYKHYKLFDWIVESIILNIDFLMFDDGPHHKQRY